eukprot:11699061-Prorocentrum_lima.AAC.1
MQCVVIVDYFFACRILSLFPCIIGLAASSLGTTNTRRRCGRDIITLLFSYRTAATHERSPSVSITDSSSSSR